jgi:creatinine amidohydrolase
MAQVVAVLPVAATEQHGPHLPTGVDTDLVNAIVERALPQIGASATALVLPTQAVGKSNEHQRFPGTLTLSAETLIRVWKEIGASVARSGIRKLLIFNAHGGQVSIMDIVARDLRCEHDLLVYSSNWYQLPLGEAVNGLFSAQEHRFGVHAGEVETSMMLALYPERVAMDQARDFASTSQERAAQYPILGNGISAKLGWQMQDYNPMGAAGNAANATAEKGHAMLNAAGTQLAALIEEIARLPLDTLRPDIDSAL